MVAVQSRETYELLRRSTRCGGSQSSAVALQIAHTIVCHSLRDPISIRMRLSAATVSTDTGAPILPVSPEPC